MIITTIPVLENATIIVSRWLRVTMREVWSYAREVSHDHPRTAGTALAVYREC